MSKLKNILKVEGMTCSHCENRVKKSLLGLSGIEKVFVDLKEKTVAVDFESDRVSLDIIKETIEDQGYGVVD